MVVILGDNVFEDDITQYVQNFVDQKQGAKILIQEVSDPQKMVFQSFVMGEFFQLKRNRLNQNRITQ